MNLSSGKTSTGTMVMWHSAAISGTSWSEMSISLTERSAGLKRRRESHTGDDCRMSGNGSTVITSGVLPNKSIGDQRMTSAFHLYKTFPSESRCPALPRAYKKAWVPLLCNEGSRKARYR